MLSIDISCGTLSYTLHSVLRIFRFHHFAFSSSMYPAFSSWKMLKMSSCLNENKRIYGEIGETHVLSSGAFNGDPSRIAMAAGCRAKSSPTVLKSQDVSSKYWRSIRSPRRANPSSGVDLRTRSNASYIVLGIPDSCIVRHIVAYLSVTGNSHTESFVFSDIVEVWYMFHHAWWKPILISNILRK